MKYHKDIYFRPQDLKKLALLNTCNNSKNFTWDNHAREAIYKRIDDKKYFYMWLRSIALDTSNIIEYTLRDNEIQKVLYRLPYDNKKDICISISKTKHIITIWFNNRGDLHNTLNKKEYATN